MFRLFFILSFSKKKKLKKKEEGRRKNETEEGWMRICFSLLYVVARVRHLETQLPGFLVLETQAAWVSFVGVRPRLPCSSIFFFNLMVAGKFSCNRIEKLYFKYNHFFRPTFWWSKSWSEFP